MKETFVYTLHAILPILFIIVLGYFVRRVGPWSESFYKQLNSLCFRLFLPIQLFCNVYGIDDLTNMNWRVIGYLFSSVFFCLLAGLLAAKLFIPDRRQKGVITQVAFRSNQAILGLPLANALGGDAAMAFASMATSVCVPLFNVLAVIVLTVFGGDGEKRTSARTLVRRVVSNPLILGALSGLLVVLIRQFLPTVDGVSVFTIRNQLPSLYAAATNLSKVASPVMLFVLGTRLNFGAVSELLPQLTLGVLLRLVICPAAVIGMAVALRTPLGLTSLEIPTLVAVASTPVAVSSAVMAQEMGGDDQLANQLVVWTSALSMVSIFCIVYILRVGGLL
ncbi:AEC family transporter [Oscillibacter sp.]|uniref:AEC family transporter n=1 Tax=Oscillibacter sp. TaxID=1945593 RepID=UPI002615743B|nr:AEC family transporter [Oscillibacter sp.]MDD3346569.1 AEC family transporter [Oscillibacter sp.]